jgi:hypothetical protein
MVKNREPDGIFGRRRLGMWETDAYQLVITRSIGRETMPSSACCWWRVVTFTMSAGVLGLAVRIRCPVSQRELAEVWGQGQSGGRDALGVTKTPPLLLLNGQRTDFEYVL